jgi:rhodanese-related sulfurtransferase
MNPDQITVTELAGWLADQQRQPPVLLDVREPSEVARCMIAGSLHVPMHSIPARLQELDQDAAIVCICHHGARSMQVARYLGQQGFSRMINLSGGIHAWATEIDHSMATY